MKNMNEIFQNGDFKTEKHVPFIDVPSKIKKGGLVAVSVSVGRELPHPNSTEHHIRFINVYFLPDGEKYPSNIGNFEFGSHGTSIMGPNTSTIYTFPGVVVYFTTEKGGTLFASSYCNIHGLWESSASFIAE